MRSGSRRNEQERAWDHVADMTELSAEPESRPAAATAPTCPFAGAATPRPAAAPLPIGATPALAKLPPPPKMPGLPLLGNNLALLRDPEAFLVNGLHEYGPG